MFLSVFQFSLVHQLILCSFLKLTKFLGYIEEVQSASFGHEKNII